MDEQQIKELIQQTVNSVKDEILQTVDTKNQGLAANIKKQVKSVEDKLTAEPKEESNDEGKLSMKALQNQIQDLNKQLQEKDRLAFEAERNSKINEVIGSKDVQAREILNRQIKTLYGDKLTKEDGQWFVQDGESVKPFDSVFDEYLKSDEGKFFLPPNQTTGTGSTKSEGQQFTGNETADKESMILGGLADL